MNSSATQSQIAWPRITALAGLQGAITFAWIAYILYLPQLLQQFGFPTIAVPTLIVIEGLFSALIEPWTGNLSDDRQRKMGSRYPLIAAGGFAACGIFILLPLIVFANPGGLLRWLLPSFLLAWALAMAVFRSPAFSLLGRHATPSSLPIAAALLSTANGLIGVFSPLGRTWLLELGSLTVFTIASVALLVAVLILGKLEVNATSTPKPKKSPDQNPSVLLLATIFCAGISASLGFRLLMDIFPKVLKGAGIIPGPIITCLLISYAVLAWPAGQLAGRIGNSKAMGFGLLAIAFLVEFLPFCANQTAAFALAVAFGASNSLISNGVYFFTCTVVPPQKIGLAMGLYFGGGGIAAALFAILGTQLSSLGVSAILSSASLILATLFIVQASSMADFSAKAETSTESQ